MCTVFLRLQPGAVWPVVVAAVRDEFVARPWDAPGRHWDGPHERFVGGRDRVAGGTWMAIDPQRGALAALLNGARPAHEVEEIQRSGAIPDPGDRPTRGSLALHALDTGGVPSDVTDYDRFHLLLADSSAARLWSWDREDLTETEIAPGDHIVVNDGLDVASDPLVPHFAPLLGDVPQNDDLEAVLPHWQELLRGDGLAGDDERALIVRREILDREYGSTSASLVAIGDPGIVYQFTADPSAADWTTVPI